MAGPVKLPEDQEQFKLNEVCKLANVQPYMLRFWGTEFPQLEAGKSTTGQRLYSREQVELILEIRRLLFDEGLTIAGARKRIGALAAKIKRAATDETSTEIVAEPSTTDDLPVEEDKPAPPPPARKAAKVDKAAVDDAQPLLATIKDVRKEVAKIVADLKK
jgi:DNA-binding transcriptional MerR regulator